MNGPYDTEGQAAAEPMPTEVRSLRRPGADARAVDSAVLRHVEQACADTGVELGAYDQRILRWLAGWEPEVAQVVIGLIRRAHQSGIDGRPWAIGLDANPDPGDAS